MKKLLLLFLFFGFVLPGFAVDLDIPNQVGLVNEQINVNLSAKSGTTAFTYAFHSSNIPRQDWVIVGNTFSWTPRKSGLYSGVFSVIDGSGNTTEDFVLFSILQSLPEKKTSTNSSSLGSSIKKEGMLSSDKKDVEYLRFNSKFLQNYYQPVALYYTRGIVPKTFNISRYGQGVVLHCAEKAKFKERVYFPYGGAIQAPSWISQLRVENNYKVKISEGTQSFVLFDLPKNVTVSGCGLVFSGQKASAYRVFSLYSETLSDPREFKNGSLIPLTTGSLILLTNEDVKTKIVIPSKGNAVTSSQIKQNPYLESLYASPLPLKFFLNNEKYALTREQMASLVINTVTPLYDKIQKEKETAHTDWGFPDVSDSDYRAEIFLMKKYGYTKGIAEFFYPKQTASMKDFYFALAEPLGIEVRWWEENTLFEALKEKGVVADIQEFSFPLNLERAARAVFLTQEELTRRGVKDFDETLPQVTRAKNDALISQDIIDNSHKDRGVSRGDFIQMLAKKFYDDFTIYNVYRAFYETQGDKVKVFDDLKKGDFLFPYAFYMREQGVLPEAWKTLNAFEADKLVTRAEALEMFLKAQGTWDVARSFYTKSIQPCFVKKNFTLCSSSMFYDLQQDQTLAEKYRIALYAKKQGILTSYTDRFDKTLNLFVGEKAITLPELLDIFYSDKKL